MLAIVILSEQRAGSLHAARGMWWLQELGHM
jgi:hypothetical protein